MVACVITAILIRWVLNAAALWIVAHLISGVTYRSIPTLLWAAALFGLVNALIPGFDVAGFWTALLAAVLLAIVGGLLSWLVRG